ncbi:hypothetical protein B0H34DRAFT_717694 [Crassisporium funariophilum]|nr:hypothetical protein B0H34DRAFT_717694 [Crassisporium funariophilum]
MHVIRPGSLVVSHEEHSGYFPFLTFSGTPAVFTPAAASLGSTKFSVSPAFLAFTSHASIDISL